MTKQTNPDILSTLGSKLNRVSRKGPRRLLLKLLSWFLVVFKPLQLIWRSQTSRFHLRVLYCRPNCCDLTLRWGTWIVVTEITTSVIQPCVRFLSPQLCISINNSLQRQSQAEWFIATECVEGCRMTGERFSHYWTFVRGPLVMFSCGWPEQAVEQTFKFSDIWSTMTLMWCYCNERLCLI